MRDVRGWGGEGAGIRAPPGRQGPPGGPATAARKSRAAMRLSNCWVITSSYATAQTKVFSWNIHPGATGRFRREPERAGTRRYVPGYVPEGVRSVGRGLTKEPYPARRTRVELA
ncbi:hypothetical protein GCM10010495_70510 [Kitasatospora herbaricolor]|nr:hypothetical protein GCM10010495_70510 [Kitasatospora herbaricolor]